MMFVIVDILLKKLDFDKFLHKHLMPQYNTGTIRYLNHDFTIILTVLFVVEQEVTLELLIQCLIYLILPFHFFEESELVVEHFFLVVFTLNNSR